MIGRLVEMATKARGAWRQRTSDKEERGVLKCKAGGRDIGSRGWGNRKGGR